MAIAAISQQLVAEIAESYPDLAALNLSSNHISEIENLEPLSRLASLDLRDNHIASLEGLGDGRLGALRELNVSRNRITGVACGRCEQLQELDLGDNAVRDWSQIEALGAAFPKLRRLVLRGNPVCQDE
eukprot:COSAG04_NODE_495_length_13411_cov_35.496094_10_plen_129_part_00